MKWLYCMIGAVTIVAATSAHAALDDARVGDRSYAMGGAHRGLGTSSDTLQVNPAGMAVAKRFSLDLQYGYTELDKMNRFGVSAVDSKSGPVAGGFGYVHERIDNVGLNQFYLGAAYPLSDALAIGVSLHHVRGDYTDALSMPTRLSLFAGDAGIMARLGDNFNIGVAYTNFTNTESVALDPARLGFGAGANLGGLIVVADMTLMPNGDRDMTYHAGAEYLASSTFPLRFGYSRQRFTRDDGSQPYENLASGGLGYLTPGGSIEVAFRRSLSRSTNWGLSAALKILF